MASVIKKIWLVCPEVDVCELELNDKVIYKTTCVGLVHSGCLPEESSNVKQSSSKANVATRISLCD